MRVFDYKKIEELIKKDKKEIRDVLIGFESEWEISCRHIWQRGKYTTKYTEDKQAISLISKLNQSEICQLYLDYAITNYDFPSIHIYYSNGKSKCERCYTII